LRLAAGAGFHRAALVEKRGDATIRPL